MLQLGRSNYRPLFDANVGTLDSLHGNRLVKRKLAIYRTPVVPVMVKILVRPTVDAGPPQPFYPEHQIVIVLPG